MYKRQTGELIKLMEPLETKVGLQVVEMVVNTTILPTVKEDLTIKVVAVVKDHTLILTTTKLLVMVLLTLAEVEAVVPLTTMVVEAKAVIDLVLVVLVLLLSDIKFNYHAQQTKVSLTPLSIGSTLC